MTYKSVCSKTTHNAKPQNAKLHTKFICIIPFFFEDCKVNNLFLGEFKAKLVNELQQNI